MRVVAICAGLVLLAGQAAAAPVFLPEHDVRVAYALAVPGHAAQEYQLRYNAGHELARIDGAPEGIYILADLSAGAAEVVIPALHATVQAPDFSGLARMIGNADNARFTPTGHGQYAGMGCRTYFVHNAEGSANVCITQGGVVLHFAGHDPHGAAQVTALDVDFRPMPADEFAMPEGYAQISLPPGALAALLQPQ